MARKAAIQGRKELVEVRRDDAPMRFAEKAAQDATAYYSSFAGRWLLRPEVVSAVMDDEYYGYYLSGEPRIYLNNETMDAFPGGKSLLAYVVAHEVAHYFRDRMVPGALATAKDPIADLIADSLEEGFAVFLSSAFETRRSENRPLAIVRSMERRHGSALATFAWKMADAIEADMSRGITDGRWPTTAYFRRIYSEDGRFGKYHGGGAAAIIAMIAREMDVDRTVADLLTKRRSQVMLDTYRVLLRDHEGGPLWELL